MFLDPQQAQQFSDPRLGLSGNRPTNVKDVAQASQPYKTALYGAGIYEGISSLAKGRMLGGIGGFLGMGAITGGADWLTNPAGNTAQTKVDTSWLSAARANDLLEGMPSFRRQPKQSARRVHMAAPPRHPLAQVRAKTSMEKISAKRAFGIQLLFEAAATREAFDAGAVKLIPSDNVKMSGTKIVISSPLEKRANFQAVVNETLGKQPYTTPGLAGPSALAKAWANRPEMLGGKPRWQRNLEKIKDLITKDELIVNASGVPIGRKRTLLPGMPGRLARIPLAIGGLYAINAGAQYVVNKRRMRGADARFENALTALREDPNFQQDYLPLIDPNGELGKSTLPSVRNAFNVLDKYAPDVTDDPNLAANFLQTIVAGKDEYGVAMTPHEYAQHTEQAINLQNAMSRRKDKTIFDNVGSMLGRLIEPE